MVLVTSVNPKIDEKAHDDRQVGCDHRDNEDNLTIHITSLKESVGKKALLCASVKILCASVVKLLQKILTTETRRSHRGTEIYLSDRLLKTATGR